MTGDPKKTDKEPKSPPKTLSDADQAVEFAGDEAKKTIEDTVDASPLGTTSSVLPQNEINNNRHVVIFF